MGSIVGGIVGNAFGGPIGAAIGSTIGGFIDQWIASELIGGDQVQRQTIGQQPNSTFSGADEGLPMRCGYGRIALAGDLIYRSARRKETAVERRSVGGKKGGSKGGESVEVTSISYYMTCAYAFSDLFPIDAVERVWLDSKLVYDFGDADPRAEEFEFLDGSQTTASSTITTLKARDGVDSFTPAYRGTPVLIVKELDLQDFGRPPSAFVQFRTEGLASGLSRQSAIERLCSLTGSASLIDTSSVDGCVRGFLTNGEASVASSLVPLMRYWGLGVMVLGDGTIKFFHHVDMPVVEVARGDFVVVSDADGSEPGFPYAVNVRDRLTLPTRVTVNHLDPRLRYEQGSQSWRASPSPHPLSSSVPVGLQHQNDVVVSASTISMTEGEATAYARRLLWTAREENKTLTLVLRPRFFWLRAGHKLRLPLFDSDGETVDVRVTKVSVRTDGGVEVEALSEATRGYVQPAATDDDRDDDAGGVYVPQDLDAVLLAVPSLGDETLETLGCGFVLRRTSPSVGEYRGGFLLRSTDGGTTYDVLAGHSNEGIVGVLRSALPAASKVGVWDEATSLTVAFTGDVPISRTADEVYSGLNWFLVGGEVVGVKNVTAASGNRYTLTGLLRGLRGTDDRAGFQHNVGSLFVALADTRFGAFPIELAEAGTVGAFKAVPARGAVADADAEAEVIVTRNAKPFRPSLRSLNRNGSGDITLTFYPRSRRIYSGVFVEQPIPIARDDPAEWQVLFLDDDDGSFYDVSADCTITNAASSFTTVSIPQSVRTARGYSSTEDATVRVVQKSAVTGEFDGAYLEVLNG